MKRKVLIVAFCCALITVSIVHCGFVLWAAQEDNPNPENKMAYTIYAYPQFGDLPNAFTAYSMDIYIENSAPCTLWSFANFNLYLSEKTKQIYPDIEGNGASAGIYNLGGSDSRRRVLIDFREWKYWPEGKPEEPYGTNFDGTPDWGGNSLNAVLLYPLNGNEFFGEPDIGSTRHSQYYDWKDKHWYRLLLYTWENEETGTTMCGFCIGDLESGVWTLISVVDTTLYDSYLVGDLQFFMENFVGGEFAGYERDFYIKNVSVKRHDTGEWVLIDTVKLSHCNDVMQNKIGKHSFGATEEYFWGKSGGYLKEFESQEQHDANWPDQVFTLQGKDVSPMEMAIQQKPAIDKMFFKKIDKVWRVRWDVAQSTMQYAYSVKVMDEKGKELLAVSDEDYTADRVEMPQVKTDVFYVELTLTDLFGNTATYRTFSDQYIEKYGEKLPSASVLPEVSEQAVTDKGSNTLLIAGIVFGVVAIVALGTYLIRKNNLK